MCYACVRPLGLHPQHSPQPPKDGIQHNSNYMEQEQQTKTKQSSFARAGAMAQQVRALPERSYQIPAPTRQLTTPCVSSSSNDFWPPLALCPHVQTHTIKSENKISLKIHLQSRRGDVLLYSQHSGDKEAGGSLCV